MRAKTLFLHGALARFGTTYRVAINTPAEGINALCAHCDGFAAMLRQGQYFVWVGGRRAPRYLAGPDLYDRFAEYHMHIMPVVAGKASGPGKMLLGLSLLGLSFVPGGQAAVLAQLGQLGATASASHLGGLSASINSQLLGSTTNWLAYSAPHQILSPQLYNAAGQIRSDQIALNQPSAEGRAIPLIYGTVHLDTAPMISAGLLVANERL
jgi:predicted phage tail protein